MSNLKILNKKEKKKLLSQLEGRNLKYNLLVDLVFLEGENDIYVSTKDPLLHDLTPYQLDHIGLHFARKKKNLEITVNAKQLFRDL